MKKYCLFWKDLKEFCNSLTDEQLEQGILEWSEEYRVIGIHAEILEEDVYSQKVNLGKKPDGFHFTRSELGLMNSEYFDGFPKEYYLEHNINMPKGTVLLKTNFRVEPL